MDNLLRALEDPQWRPGDDQPQIEDPQLLVDVDPREEDARREEPMGLPEAIEPFPDVVGPPPMPAGWRDLEDIGVGGPDRSLSPDGWQDQQDIFNFDEDEDIQPVEPRRRLFHSDDD